MRGMLRDAGVCVADMLASGMPHGFYESGFGKISEGEMDFLGDDVKEMIRNEKSHRHHRNVWILSKKIFRRQQRKKIGRAFGAWEIQSGFPYSRKGSL